MAHCILLQQISVRERARKLGNPTPELLHILLNNFLPTVMLTVADSLATAASFPFDIDGRVFCSLVGFLSVHHSEGLPRLIGHSAYEILTKLWSQIGSPSVSLSTFAAGFRHNPLELSSLSTSPKVEHFRLLPFDNDLFNAELALVRVPVSDKRNPPRPTKLEFGGKGTLFSDTQHWHNQKAILPSYLGGSDPKPLNERARRRALRKDQRFMATMQAQAATLIGASGGALKPIVIPPVGVSKSTQKHRLSTPVVKVNIDS